MSIPAHSWSSSCASICGSPAPMSAATPRSAAPASSISNGIAVKSCTTLALQCEGANVLTIEGLAAPDGPLHPMQEAFRENHGLQCGFCTPGMVMSAVDMVNRKGNDLDEHTIRQELDGNLCRCTGYHNIVKAIAAGAKAMKGIRRPRNFARSLSSRRKAMTVETRRPGSAHRCAARKTSASSPARASTPTTSAVRARPGRCSSARRMRMPRSKRSMSTRRKKCRAWSRC